MFEVMAPSDRRAFLRRLGKTAMIGLGIAMFPVSSAHAAPITCCADTGGNCPSCGPGHTTMYCTGIDCCFCESRVGNCFTYETPPC
jgi:hypothetical protein